MVSVKFKKEDREFEKFNDYWHFVQECYMPESVEDWQIIFDRGDRLIHKYSDDPYMYELIKKHMHDIEKRLADAKAEKEVKNC